MSPSCSFCRPYDVCSCMDHVLVLFSDTSHNVCAWHCRLDCIQSKTTSYSSLCRIWTVPHIRYISCFINMHIWMICVCPCVFVCSAERSVSCEDVPGKHGTQYILAQRVVLSLCAHARRTTHHTHQVTYQMKIFTTAIFSITMLNKKITGEQWVALLMLAAGVATVQVGAQGSQSKTPDVGQSTVVGLVAVIAACCTSGFAGVYFEKILKGTKQSVWLR